MKERREGAFICQGPGARQVQSHGAESACLAGEGEGGQCAWGSLREGEWVGGEGRERGREGDIHEDQFGASTW